MYRWRIAFDYLNASCHRPGLEERLKELHDLRNIPDFYDKMLNWEESEDNYLEGIHLEWELLVDSSALVVVSHFSSTYLRSTIRLKL